MVDKRCGWPIGAGVVCGLAGIASLLAGCGANHEAPEELGTVEEAVTLRSLTITVPVGKRASDVAASGSSTLKVSDRGAMRIEGGGFPLASSLGSGTLELGADSVAGSLIAKGPVFLRERARVNGDLITGAAKTAQGSRTVVTGTVSQFADVQAKTWSRDISFPDATLGVVSLEPDKTRVLLPGAFSDLSVKHARSLKHQRPLDSGRFVGVIATA